MAPRVHMVRRYVKTALSLTEYKFLKDCLGYNRHVRMEGLLTQEKLRTPASL
jgi:hypothetical protein